MGRGDAAGGQGPPLGESLVPTCHRGRRFAGVSVSALLGALRGPRSPPGHPQPQALRNAQCVKNSRAQGSLPGVRVCGPSVDLVT